MSVYVLTEPLSVAISVPSVSGLPLEPVILYTLKLLTPLLSSQVSTTLPGCDTFGVCSCGLLGTACSSTTFEYTELPAELYATMTYEPSWLMLRDEMFCVTLVVLVIGFVAPLACR